MGRSERDWRRCEAREGVRPRAQLDEKPASPHTEDLFGRKTLLGREPRPGDAMSETRERRDVKPVGDHGGGATGGLEAGEPPTWRVERATVDA